MSKYELMVVLDGQQTDEAIEATLKKIDDIITEGGCSIEKTDLWGKRRLAYPIRDKVDGHYSVRWFSPGTQPLKPMFDQIRRQERIDESILRTLAIELPRTKNPIPVITRPDATKDANPDWGLARRGYRPPRQYDRRDDERSGPPPRRPSSDEEE
jgi:small subunit ribosomal protein S6